jgi:hypothetical protein
MQNEIPIGTVISYHDTSVGSIERVERNAATGQMEALILRSGRSPGLLRIAAAFIRPDGPAGWQIDPNLALDSLEQEALDSGVLPPVGEHLGDAGSSEPAPPPEVTLGPPSGITGEYDGPATG